MMTLAERHRAQGSWYEVRFWHCGYTTAWCNMVEGKPRMLFNGTLRKTPSFYIA